MKRIAPLLLAASLTTGLITAPALAEEEEAGAGRSMMQQGLELFMNGLRQEMSPAMENLRDLAERFGPAMSSFLEEMGPALAGMMDEVKDWTRYYPPEMLPNGDIIMRRRLDPRTESEPDSGAEPAPEPAPGAEAPAPSGPTDI